MRTKTFEETVKTTFVIETCCTCGIAFAMTEEFAAARRRKRDWFYCPLGHSQYYPGETQAQQLSKANAEVQRLNNLLKWEQEYGRETQRNLEAAKMEIRTRKCALTKLKNRVHNGVCPCCKRTFANLSRHMHTQHPDYTKDEGAEP